MRQTRFKLTEFPEHIGTNPVHQTIIERGKVEDIVVWGLKQLKDQGRLRIITFIQSLNREEYKKILFQSPPRDGPCLILDPPPAPEVTWPEVERRRDSVWKCGYYGGRRKKPEPDIPV